MPDFEMNSSTDQLLVSGATEDNQATDFVLQIYISDFESDEDVKKATCFIKQFSSAWEVQFRFSSDRAPDNFYKTIFLPMLRACQESGMQTIVMAVPLGVGFQDHIKFFGTHEFKNLVPKIILSIHGSPDLDTSTLPQLDFGALPKIDWLYVASSAMSHLSYIKEARFPNTAKMLRVETVHSQAEAEEVLSFLREHRIPELYVTKSNTMEATSLLLKSVTASETNYLDFLFIKTEAMISANSSSLLSNLESTVANLSPRIKTLWLNFTTDLSADTNEQLKEKLLSGMEKSTGTLYLDTFCFECNNDKELFGICSAFAAKKMIERFTNGSTRVPPTGLPRAVKAIKRHPFINRENYATTLVFEYIRTGGQELVEIIEKNIKKRAALDEGNGGPMAKRKRLNWMNSWGANPYRGM